MNSSVIIHKVELLGVCITVHVTNAFFVDNINEFWENTEVWFFTSKVKNTKFPLNEVSTYF